MTPARIVRTRPDGLPVYGYEPDPVAPPVRVVALAGPPAPVRGRPDRPTPPAHLHAHDFLIVAYVESDGGGLRFGPQVWPGRAGDAYLIAPGDIVGAGGDRDGPGTVHGRAVCFTPDILGPAASSPLTWHTHPLLFPFARPAVSEPRRLPVPPGERGDWAAHLDTIHRELGDRRPGRHHAVAAALTLLLVRVTRLAPANRPDTRPGPDSLLTDVLAYIDEHYHEPVSLRDVARAVGLSPGHLTTVVGRRTGRTVHGWINHRRLTEARRLLAGTDLAVEAVGRHVGYRDAGYFARAFRRDHGVAPRAWRRATRDDPSNA